MKAISGSGRKSGNGGKWKILMLVHPHFRQKFVFPRGRSNALSLLGKILTSPVRVAATVTRVATMGVDWSLGEDTSPQENILDEIADMVEEDVDKMVGEE
jgi:hypothetical protein